MSNPLFNAICGYSPTNILQMIQQIRANPAQILSKRFNLPQNITSPNDIIQHLVNTGQITQEQLNSAYQQAQRMGIKR
jgi:hypothetical protein